MVVTHGAHALGAQAGAQAGAQGAGQGCGQLSVALRRASPSAWFAEAVSPTAAAC